MSEEEALWQAIDAMPEDALRRLVLADWLEENAGVVACGCLNAAMHAGRVSLSFEGVPVADMGLVATFSCDLCNGTGFTLDGRADLARALRATAGKVPFHTPRAKPMDEVWTWWGGEQPARLVKPGDEECRIGSKLFTQLSPPLVTNWDGLADYPTAELAIRDLCRAWVAVNTKREVTA